MIQNCSTTFNVMWREILNTCRIHAENNSKRQNLTGEKKAETKLSECLTLNES